MWRSIIFSLTVACGCFLATSPAAAATPNILIVLCDDLGYGDVGCYGGRIATPVLDRLASQGLRFTDAHTSSSVCSPTRYGLLTGRYNWRSKLQRSVLGGLSPRLIEPGRETIASLLQRRDYRTACIGKWHLGMNWVLKPGAAVSELSIESRDQVFNVDYLQPISQGPNSVGFDFYYGISASLDMVPYAFIENDRITAPPTLDRGFEMMLGRGGQSRPGPTAPDFDAADVLPTLARKSVEFVTAAAHAGQPFLLYLPLASPHTPILPTEPWQGQSGMNPYADFVMQTDAAIGEVLAALDDADVAENTLVLVTSDNGCSPQAKFDELLAHGHDPSGPLRGHKADLFEGGHRVPLIARWPGVVAAGTTTDQVVCLTDVLATVAEIVGEDLPDDAGEDSYSFLPVLRGAGPTARPHLVSHSIEGAFAIRRGAWKLLLAADSGGWSEPRPGSPAAAELPPNQLYDLTTDLGEEHNRAADYPEVVAELTALLERIVDQGRSTPGKRQPNAVPVEIRKRSQRRS